MQEKWVQSLCQEDPLAKGMVTHSSVLAWEIPCAEEPSRPTAHGAAKTDTTERLSTQHIHTDASECDYIWSQGLYRGNSSKMNSYGWTLLQNDRCPYKKQLGQRSVCAQREDHVRTQWWACHLQAKERDLRRKQTCQHLDLGFLAPELWERNFCRLNHPVCGISWWQSG